MFSRRGTSEGKGRVLRVRAAVIRGFRWVRGVGRGTFSEGQMGVNFGWRM